MVSNDEFIYVVKHGIQDLNANLQDLNTCVCNSMSITDTKISSIDNQLLEIDKSLLSISLSLCQRLDALLSYQLERDQHLKDIMLGVLNQLNTNLEKIIDKK